MNILCIGHALIDVVALGLDRWPMGHEVKELLKISPVLGGGAANTAGVLSQLGHETRCLAPRGRDFLGAHVDRRLAALGVRCDLLVRSKNAPTACNLVAVDSAGVPAYFVQERPRGWLTADVLSRIDIRSLNWIHISNVNCLIDDDEELLRGWLDDTRGRRAGELSVSVDLAKQLELAGNIGRLTGRIDVCFANQFEAGKATQQEIPSAMLAELHQLTAAKTVIIKFGGKGAFWRDGAEMGHVPAFCVKVVNENGAGDVFCAGVINKLARQSIRSLSDAVEEGCWLASRHVSSSMGIVANLKEPKSNARGEALRSPSFEVHQSLGGLEYAGRDEGGPFGYSLEVGEENVQWWVNKVKQHAKLDENSWILDGGCGFGRFAVKLEDLYLQEGKQGTGRIIGLDVSETMLRTARRNPTGGKVLWRNDDLLWMSRIDDPGNWPYGGFDCIWLSEIIDEFPREQIEQLFEQVFHQLKPGGQAIFRLTTPELLAEVPWYADFPDALAEEQARNLPLGKLVHYLEQNRFKVAYIERRDDSLLIDQADFFGRITSRAPRWLHFPAAKFEERMRNLKNKLERLNQSSPQAMIDWRVPMYLVVCRKPA